MSSITTKPYMKAITEINPSAQVEMWSNDLSTINWLNGTTPISIEDIEAKATEIETRDAHIEPRQKAYPSITDQLDMQYHDKVDGTTTWQDAIQAVKDANPKP
jgi:FKBP-type peptidyl-prolyl cis-trans isomerase (trigger factor)